MIKLENTEVVGWRAAIRGMRNPMNSWDKSDSYFGFMYDYPDDYEPVHKALIGPNDLKLMTSLAKGGPVHAKYRRMIGVYVDITAPLYWWKEFDTYKVGTVANSCSTMHKIHEKEFAADDFSSKFLGPHGISLLLYTMDNLNNYRDMYLNWDKVSDKSKNYYGFRSKKDCWWQMIQLLPSSYMQKRTVLMNYEVLHNLYFSRNGHKMGPGHWDVIIDWIEHLPYSELITTPEKRKEDGWIEVNEETIKTIESDTEYLLEIEIQDGNRIHVIAEIPSCEFTDVKCNGKFMPMWSGEPVAFDKIKRFKKLEA